jgi:hypothetical protein
VIREIQQLLANYAEWLKDRTSIRQVEDWVEITTPFLDRHNDYVQIYAAREVRGFLLTDDGYTLADLERSGCKLDSEKRRSLLRTTLNGFGVQLADAALVVHASAENFAVRKHNLVQAILAVNDLFFLSMPVIASLFYEDVVTWLDLHDIRYTPHVKFTGKTGYDYMFDFVIPKSRREPERIVQTINRPAPDTAKALVLAWVDTKEVRPPASSAYALLNDLEISVSPGVLDALRSYDVHPILWSERESIGPKFAA